MFRTVLIFVAVLVASGCQNLYYYGQVIDGQLDILKHREPIEKLIEDPEIEEKLKTRLLFILNVRKFAQKDLHLPVENNYLTYVDLNRSYILWNVFAAPEFSLEPKTWCYPIVGCVAYRGYFSKTDALSYAETLKQENYDVYVAGVGAYSTLGWFDDPVLSTMMRLSETDSAALIFHELAHKLLYVAGDSAFSESFATAVEQEGVRRWLIAKGDRQAYGEYQLSYRRHRQFVDLIVQYRTRFESIYHNQEEESVKRARKATLFTRMIQDHEALKKDWDGTSRFDNWFRQPLNNAKLASVFTYQNWVPAFNAILNANNGDLAQFYEECQELAEKAKSERYEILAGFTDDNE